VTVGLGEEGIIKGKIVKVVPYFQKKTPPTLPFNPRKYPPPYYYSIITEGQKGSRKSREPCKA